MGKIIFRKGWGVGGRVGCKEAGNKFPDFKSPETGISAVVQCIKSLFFNQKGLFIIVIGICFGFILYSRAYIRRGLLKKISKRFEFEGRTDVRRAYIRRSLFI